MIQQLDSAHQHSMVPSGNDAATPGWIAGETGVAPDLLSLPAVVHQNEPPPKGAVFFILRAEQTERWLNKLLCCANDSTQILHGKLLCISLGFSSDTMYMHSLSQRQFRRKRSTLIVRRYLEETDSWMVSQRQIVLKKSEPGHACVVKPNARRHQHEVAHYDLVLQQHLVSDVW